LNLWENPHDPHLNRRTTSFTTMAPSVTIDTTSDFEMPSSNTTTTTTQQRTLLLAPPSLAAHPEALNTILEAHDRTATDIQMLDRLALGLVSLPADTYDLVMLLSDADGNRGVVLERSVVERVVPALKTEGRLCARQGSLRGEEVTEGVLAGLVGEADGLKKPQAAAAQTVKLSFGKKKQQQQQQQQTKADAAAVPANKTEAVNVAKRKSVDISTSGSGVVKSTPAGVGFVELGDEFGNDYDEDEDMEIPSNEELARAEKIDPDSLLSEADRQKPLNIRTFPLPKLPHNHPLTHPSLQPKPASPLPSAAAPAKTAAAGSRSG
jgi:prolyl-tRNA synthetase